MDLPKVNVLFFQLFFSVKLLIFFCLRNNLQTHLVLQLDNIMLFHDHIYPEAKIHNYSVR